MAEITDNGKRARFHLEKSKESMADDPRTPEPYGSYRHAGAEVSLGVPEQRTVWKM